MLLLILVLGSFLVILFWVIFCIVALGSFFILVGAHCSCWRVPALICLVLLFFVCVRILGSCFLLLILFLCLILLFLFLHVCSFSCVYCGFLVDLVFASLLAKATEIMFLFFLILCLRLYWGRRWKLSCWFFALVGLPAIFSCRQNVGMSLKFNTVLMFVIVISKYEIQCRSNV